MAASKNSQPTVNPLDDELSQRELAIARVAAKMAVQQIQQEFYAEVGRNVVTKGFVIVGIVAVAFATGKGWISWK
jgi:hypothetical protein